MLPKLPILPLSDNQSTIQAMANSKYPSGQYILAGEQKHVGVDAEVVVGQREGDKGEADGHVDALQGADLVVDALFVL